jgi:uncharacterized membrane protein YgdD (TMEM256/DUF423 family)
LGVLLFSGSIYLLATNDLTALILKLFLYPIGGLTYAACVFSLSKLVKKIIKNKNSNTI